MDPVIIVHGGIEFGRSIDTADGKQIALKNAVIQGYALLRVGDSSIDAVEATLRILEDDEQFNAGSGAVVNADGEAELDAGIMDGMGLRVGSVGAVKNVEHPITLAKYVMESTDHSMLVAEGAEKFAVLKNLAQLPPRSRDPPDSSVQEFGPGIKKPESGTVGVVAIDTEGRCTVGTSSGGGSSKMSGRVGSSAVVGGGFYADSTIGGAVATGHGESIMKSCLCFNLVDQMKVQTLRGDLTMIAVSNVVENATRRSKNAVGAVALDHSGEFGVAFSAPRMPWAYCRLGRLRYGAESGENYEELL